MPPVEHVARGEHGDEIVQVPPPRGGYRQGMRAVLSVWSTMIAAALVACGAPAASPSPRNPTMPSDSSKQLVRRLFEDIINSGDLDRLGEVISADFVGPTDQRGPAGFAGVIAALRIGFPDIQYTLDELLAEGDRVAVRWTWHGTHTGPFRSFPPSGKLVDRDRPARLPDRGRGDRGQPGVRTAAAAGEVGEHPLD
jgi:predicted ester cyclase